MTHLEELKQAIVKANPEIMLPNIGCEFECMAGIARIIDNLNDGRYVVHYSNMREKMYVEDGLTLGNYTNLGRPIHISDVLVAMEKHKEFWRYFLRPDGGFIEIDNIQGSRRVGFYDLTKSFEDQSPETINFLHKILVGEKE